MPDMTLKDIPGYEGLYSVSDWGWIVSCVKDSDGEILCPSLTSRGYERVTLYREGISTEWPVHKLVMLTFVGPPSPQHEINHKSGVKTENWLDNLEYCTSSENRLHAFRIGIQTPAHGEKHCRAKLSAAQVKEMIELRAAGWTHARIAAKYHVAQSTATRIVNRKRWVRTKLDG